MARLVQAMEIAEKVALLTVSRVCQANPLRQEIAEHTQGHPRLLILLRFGKRDEVLELFNIPVKLLFAPFAHTYRFHSAPPYALIASIPRQQKTPIS